MTEKEIIEGNKLLAEFVGGYKRKVGVPHDNSLIWDADTIQPFLSKSDEQLEFHKSWDWLMPVVEKIESIEDSDDYEVDIFGNCCDIGGRIETVGKTKIEGTWKACVEFVKKYNQSKSEQND